MRNIRLAFPACILWALLGAPVWAGLQAHFNGPPAEVEVYDYMEMEIRVKDTDLANPFTDAEVRGVFRTDGREAIHVDGFCDSPDGSVFRIRFMPVHAGTYDFEITYRNLASSTAQGDSSASRGSKRGLTVSDATAFAKGSFEAVPSDRKGLLRVDPDNHWHFIWEGTGEHYFWNGTTTYYLMGWDEETIRESIDRLARLQINRLRVLVYGRNKPRPWGQPVVPTENFQLHLNPWPAERPDDIENPDFDLTRFNVEHWQKYERLLKYAREKDVIISVIFYIGGQVLPTPFEANSEEEDLYYRYGVARLAAFSNVTWDLGNEYNFHRKAPEWADAMGHKVKEWDPYDHLTSAHNVAHRTPQSTWLDMQLIQRWDSGQNAFMLSQREAQEQIGYVIPQINEEYGYEDLWEKYPGHRAAETRRKNAWEIYMAGCYQTTGESARRGTGVPPDTGGGWVNGRGDDQMTMLIGYGHIVEFFTAFDWWNCRPLNEAVEGPASCLGKSGELYILYFREGGRADVKLTYDQYCGRWYNPRTGNWKGTCQGSGPGWTTPPTPDDNDWVLWLEKDETLRDESPPEVVAVLTGGKGEKILVEFNEQPKEPFATEPGNYRITPRVKIEDIAMGGRYGKTAVLSVGNLKEDRSYTLRVTDVKDLAGNQLHATEKSFTYIPPGRPLVELAFDSGDGRTARNSGTTHDVAAKAELTRERPGWSSNTPPHGGSHSLNFSREAGEYAVDVPEEAAEALESLKSFTITAWVNATSNEEGAGGNRIVHMADTMGTKAGVDLVVTRNGQLKIGIDEWPDTTKAVSSPGVIPFDRNAGEENWRFVAVTYDPTAERDHLKFYIGTPTAAARLDKAISYDRGPVDKPTGTLTIGHFNPSLRSGHGDRMFRGLIDEVRVFGSKLDGSAALPLEQIQAVQKGQ